MAPRIDKDRLLKLLAEKCATPAEYKEYEEKLLAVFQDYESHCEKSNERKQKILKESYRKLDNLENLSGYNPTALFLVTFLFCIAGIITAFLFDMKG